MSEQPAPSFMAPPAAVTPASAEDAATSLQGMMNFRGVLRDLRAEAQDLRASLVQIREKTKLEDAETRAKELKASLAKAEGVFERNRQRINELLGKVRQCFDKQPLIYDWCSDEVTHMENSWGRVGDNWPQADQPEEQLTKNIDAATAAVDRMIYLCGQLTIPARVNQHLKTLRIGQALDFHRNFSDELELPEDRLRLLTYMADHPYIVDGVVDARNGVIYRASRDPRRRLLSYVMLLIAVGLGFGVAFVLTNMHVWLNITGWQPAEHDFGSLATVYVFLLLGAVAHLLVSSVKQAQSGAETSAMKDWLMWIHVKESSLLMGVLYIWIGLIALAFSFKELQWTTGFFVGYSIDSFVDTFLQRFSQVVSAQNEALGIKSGEAARPEAAGQAGVSK